VKAQQGRGQARWERTAVTLCAAEGKTWVEVEQELDGRLDGLTAVARLELMDGEIYLAELTYRTTKPIRFADGFGVRMMRDLRLGEIQKIVRQRLARAGEAALPWLQALDRHRRRPGRAGTADLRYAKVAQLRIEAERRWPRKAIENMVREWPAEFRSESAATALVHQAIHRGLLERTEHGPRLTPKAIELLSAEPEPADEAPPEMSLYVPRSRRLSNKSS
jgi:hypothetical protein